MSDVSIDRLKQEISYIFNIPINEISHTNLEDHLYYLLNETHSDILAVRLINKFKTEHSKNTKDILCRFILNLIHHPEICKQSDSATLEPEEIFANLIMDSLNPNHHIIIDCIKYIDSMKNKEYEDLFIAVLQVFSNRCFGINIFDDFMKFIDPLLILIELKSVQDALNTPELWIIFNYKKQIIIPRFQKSIYLYLRLYLRSFFYGFLGVFIYYELDKKKGFIRYMQPDINNQGKLMELKYEIDTKINLFHDTLYQFILRLFTKKIETKILFQKFLIGVINNNKDRTKFNFDIKLVDTDGMMFNLSGILTRFCSKIINKELYDLINPGFLSVFDDSLIDSNIKIKNNEKSQKSFTSCVFFCKLKFMELGIMKIINDIKHNNREIYQLEYEILNQNNIQMTETRRNQLKEIKEIIKSRNVAYKIILRSNLVESDYIFIEFVCSYLIEMFGKELPDFYYINKLKSNSLSNLTLKDSLKDSIVICSVKTFPEYIYNTLFFLQMSFQKLPKPFMFLAAQIFNTELPNISFKSYLVRAFEDRPSIELIPDVFIGFLKYYVELDKLDDFNFDRTNTRTSIIHSLNSDSLNRITSLNTKNPIHLKFLHSFLNDIKKNLSNGLSAIKDIKYFYLNKDKFSREILEEKTRKLRRDENTAEHSFNQLNIFLKFLHRLIKSSAYNLFSNRLIINTFVGILNCNLKIIVGPSSSSLRVNDKKKYNFEPRNILFLIISIYLIMDERCTIKPKKEEDLLLLNRNIFLEEIISDKIYFSIDLFIKAYEICKGKCILGEEELYKLKQFLNKLNNLYNEKTENKIKEDIEIPDEFIDPLTFSVMENPVKLLTSGKIVDMETYEMLMLGDSLDPFNRELLSIDKIKEENELKKQIEDWNKKYK